MDRRRKFGRRPTPQSPEPSPAPAPTSDVNIVLDALKTILVGVLTAERERTDSKIAVLHESLSDLVSATSSLKEIMSDQLAKDERDLEAAKIALAQRPVPAHLRKLNGHTPPRSEA